MVTAQNITTKQDIVKPLQYVSEGDRVATPALYGVTPSSAGVESLLFRYLVDDGNWTDQWPPESAPGPLGLRQRPRAVEIILTLQDEGEIRRIVEIAP